MKKMKLKVAGLALFTGAARLLLAIDVMAQTEVNLPELPMTAKHGVGARAAGMGFAHLAVAEDGSSLFYNPGGLAQVRRIEVSGGLLHDAQDREVGFKVQGSTNEQSSDLGSTQVGHLSLVYPFPTYRGSLVFGVAYQRVVSLDSDYFRNGFLFVPTPDRDGLLETESFLEDGGVNFWTAGLAGDVSPHVSLGGTLSFIEGTTRQDFEIGRLRASSSGRTDVNGSDEVFRSNETRTADLTGWTASIGALARASEMVRLGLVVDLPQRYDFEGTVRGRFEDQEKIDTSSFSFEDRITLPVSVGGGIAVTPRNLLLAMDVKVTDWTQIEFEGPIRSQDRENAYRSTVDFNVGLEYQLSFHPVRVRAGFSSQPLPYKLEPDEIDFTFVPDDGNSSTSDDRSFFTRSYPEADVRTDRTFLTLGFGTLVDNSVSLDVAYIHGQFDRSGSAISEKWTTNRIFGTVSFRF